MKKLVIRFIENWFKYTQLKINLWMLRDKIRYYRLMYSGKVLDIGAGTKPYRELFDEVSEYIGTNTRRHYEINNLVPDIETTDVWIEDGTSLPFRRWHLRWGSMFSGITLNCPPRQILQGS